MVLYESSLSLILIFQRKPMIVTHCLLGTADVVNGLFPNVKASRVLQG